MKSTKINQLCSERIGAADDADADLLNKCAIEQEALNYFLRELDLAQALKDPMQSKWFAMKGPDSFFSLMRYGHEEFTYGIHLVCKLSDKTGLPLIHAYLVARGPGTDGPLYLTKDAEFGIGSNKKLRRACFLDAYYISESVPIKILGSKSVFCKSLKPGDLGMSPKTARLLIELGMSVSAGMARNISTESYDFDFSEVLDTNQDATSGLSL